MNFLKTELSPEEFNKLQTPTKGYIKREKTYGIMKCSICNKKFIRKHYFELCCSNKCKKIRSDELMMKWKSKGQLLSCSICGTKNKYHLVVHHLDRNHGNNNRDNLMVLCSNHHGELHKKKLSKSEALKWVQTKKIRVNNMEYKKLKIKDNEEVKGVIDVDEKRLIDIHSDKTIRDENSFVLAEKRCMEEFKNKSLYLNNKYDWVLGKDSNDGICLIPLKKGD